MTKIDAVTRQFVLTRAKGLCEYCHAPVHLFDETWHVDHIIPLSYNGVNDETNLCCACVRCNANKRKHLTGIDPETSVELSLFNPRNQIWFDHFFWNEENILIIAQTPIGRATLSRLQLNRLTSVKARPFWLRMGWLPPLTTRVTLKTSIHTGIGKPTRKLVRV